MELAQQAASAAKGKETTMTAVIQVHGSATSKLAHLINDDNNYWTADTALCGAKIWSGSFDGKDAFGDPTCVKCMNVAKRVAPLSNPDDYDFTYPESIADLSSGDLFDPLALFEELD